MAFEKMIKNAFDESRNNCRFGDTLEEIKEIQDYIKNAEKIYIPNKDGIKVDVLNKVLNEYKEYLEWIEIEKIGMTYEINFEQRINKKEDKVDGLCDVVAESDGIVSKIKSSSGVILVKVNQSVKKGDLLISGDIKLNDIDKTTIFFAKTNEEFTYYVPVTKISNTISDKIDIIIEELKSTVNSQDNLNSYINNNVKLVSKEINDEKINLIFNNYIFSDLNNKTILEEVKYIISESIFENYDVKEVSFSSETDKNIKFIIKK